MRYVIVALAALGAGVLLGQFRGVAPTPPAALVTTAAPTSPPPSVFGLAPGAQIDLNAFKNEVRDIVQKEVRAALPPSAAPNKLLPPTADELQAHERGRELVTNSLSTHRWTRDQGLQLRLLMGRMNDQQRKDVLSALIPPINRQEIKLDSPGPLF